MGAHEWTCAPGFPSVVTDLDRNAAARRNGIAAAEAQPLRREVGRELAAVRDPDAVRRTALDGPYGLPLRGGRERRSSLAEGVSV